MKVFIFLIFLQISFGKEINQDRKRTLPDPSIDLPPPPYSIYPPGPSPMLYKAPLPLPYYYYPLPSIFLNRFATPIPTFSQIFKSKKDAFLSKLINDLATSDDSTMNVEARSAEVLPEVDPTSVSTTTVKPKIDTSAFVAKKFDFLTKLFKTLNTTTVAPTSTVEGEVSTSTIKPTIVPPEFWLPATLPPKLTKPPKPTKASKAKAVLLDAVDQALLKQLLLQIDPSSAPKQARAISFLDKLLHKESPPPTTTTPATTEPSSTTEHVDLSARSLLLPYIYTAKMGIYLDKIFDTLDDGSSTEEKAAEIAKRVASDPAAIMILAQLAQIKKNMVDVFAEVAPTTTPAPSKFAAKSFKKPFWGPPTTASIVAADAAKKRLDVLSDLFDSLLTLEESMLIADKSTAKRGVTGPTKPISPTTTTSTTTIVPPFYWIPDPSSPDIASYYKTKSADFLNQLFLNKIVTTEEPVN